MSSDRAAQKKLDPNQPNSDISLLNIKAGITGNFKRLNESLRLKCAESVMTESVGYRRPDKPTVLSKTNSKESLMNSPSKSALIP